MSQLDFRPPILITGAPRSGTSLVAGIFHKCGAWLGACAGEHTGNPKGFFENLALRNGINKTMLAMLQADYRGVTSLPPRYVDFDIALKGLVYDNISCGGCPTDGSWAFKDPKLALLWRPWARSFPDATWIIVDRPLEDSASSSQATFLNYNTGEEKWGHAMWMEHAREYRVRLDDIEAHVERCYRIDTEALIAGDFSQIREAVESTGLTWSSEAEAFVDRGCWKRWDMEKAS